MLVTMKGVTVSYVQTIRDWLNAQNATIRLFQNDIVPTENDTLGMYQLATFTGYSSLLINDWTGGALNAQGYAEITAPAKLFNQTGVATVNTIYGYFIVSSANVLLIAERNPGGGVLMNQAGYSYTVNPKFYIRNDLGGAAMAVQAASAEQGRAEIEEVKSEVKTSLPPRPQPAPPSRPGTTSRPSSSPPRPQR